MTQNEEIWTASAISGYVFRFYYSLTYVYSHISIVQQTIGSKTTGIISVGANHSDCAWFVRTRPRIKEAFAKIWKTDDLLVSFDAMNLFLPWHRSKHTEIMDKSMAGWYHVDQGITKGSDMQCVQGLVTLKDASEYTGGICVVEKSHLKHKSLLEYAAVTKGDFVFVPTHDPILDKNQKMIRCKAGDMVLWDSRTIHCNSPALSRPKSPVNELLRQVVYVCMTPRSKASDEVIRCRCRGAMDNVGTNHWPHLWNPTSATDLKVSGNKFTATQLEGIEMYRKACKLEEKKMLKQATDFYSKAYKLYPDLEKNAGDVLSSYVDPLTDEEKSKICSDMSAAKRWLVGFRDDANTACKK